MRRLNEKIDNSNMTLTLRRCHFLWIEIIFSAVNYCWIRHGVVRQMQILIHSGFAVVNYIILRNLPSSTMRYLRNRSALAVICWVINHSLEVSCKIDQITSAERGWFIFIQLTDKLWFITKQITHELIYFDSNTKETTKKSLYPSDSPNFPPSNDEIPLTVLTVTLTFTCIPYVVDTRKTMLHRLMSWKRRLT